MTETSFETPNFATMRRAMVASQLRTTAVNDPRVVSAMGSVPREDFVPEAWRRFAYADRAIPLGAERVLPPAMVPGRLLTEARTRPADRALVIGAGSGYSAAVLARLVANVVALEAAEVPDAPAVARVRRVTGPLAEGWTAGGPYDLILFDGAIERVPPAIVDQLAEGGRLAAPLLRDGIPRLSVGVRAGAGFGFTEYAEADVPVLPGFARPREFSF